MENTENQAKRIQSVIECVKNGDIRGAFSLMYRGAEMWESIKPNCDKVIETLMRERANGNFFTACAIFEAGYSNDKERVEKAKKSKAVRDFVAEYKEWRSGYSMGEEVFVCYDTRNFSFKERIADRKSFYSERSKRAKKYNCNISHGAAWMDVDLKGSRMKTSVSRIEKQQGRREPQSR